VNEADHFYQDRLGTNTTRRENSLQKQGACLLSFFLSLSLAGSGQALATTLNWIFAFLVTRTFGSLVASVGEGGAFRVYAVLCALFATYAARFVPAAPQKSDGSR
jgi:hypothetical protein